MKDEFGVEWLNEELDFWDSTRCDNLGRILQSIDEAEYGQCNTQCNMGEILESLKSTNELYSLVDVSYHCNNNYNDDIDDIDEDERKNCYDLCTGQGEDPQPNCNTTVQGSYECLQGECLQYNSGITNTMDIMCRNINTGGPIIVNQDDLARIRAPPQLRVQLPGSSGSSGYGGGS